MTNRTLRALLSLVPALLPAVALSQSAPAPIDPARVEAALKSSWTGVAPQWVARLERDETMKACTTYRTRMPNAVVSAIRQREAATIKYPADNVLMGDWKKGERIAQSGYGLRFTDYPPANPNGGNCYACHQLDPKEVSYGTIGPSLLGYGKLRKFADREVKAVYDKIYNSHASSPCSLMPRFGSNGVLDTEQIKDLVALVMSPDSPVNK